MLDFTTLVKWMLEEVMKNEGKGGRCFWALWSLLLLAVVLFGGAALLTAIAALMRG